MKKILAILLVLTMVFSLAACGNKSNDTGKNETPSTENTETQKPEETVDTAAKQAFYDTYFTTEAYQLAGNSCTMKSENVTMNQVIDAQGYGVLDITVGGNYVRIYRVEGGVYLLSHGPSDDNPEEIVDTWLTYKEKETENVLESNEMLGGKMDVSEAISVKFVNTKDGVDHVTVEMPNEQYVEGVKTMKYQLKFLDNNKEYIAKVQVTTGGVDYTMYDNLDEMPESWGADSYHFDVTQMALVDDDNKAVIPVEIVSEKDISEQPTIVADFYIDTESQKVVKVGATEKGVYTTMEFSNVEKYEPDVEFPADAQECTSEELGLIIFAMLIMTMSA